MAFETAAQTDSDFCASLQQEELVVLQAIHPDWVFGDVSNGSLKLEIPTEFESPRAVEIIEDTILSARSLETPSATREQLLSLSTLPPLLLHLILSPEYPLRTPPEIVSLHASHSWLPRVDALKRLLLEMWQPGEGVLYLWVELIRSGGFLESLNMSSGSTLRISHPAPHVLSPLLTSHDSNAKSSQFAKSMFYCSVCLSDQKGSRCLQLACSHVFCRACLEDFWALCITEGDVDRVGCPDPDCVKAGIEAQEEEVRRVLPEEQITRLRWLREKRALERDPTIIHCPMAFCQAPVPKPPVLDEESGWARLRTCPRCDCSFCAFCKRTWHGPITHCPISTSETFVLVLEEYMALEEGSEEQLKLERRFGKKHLRALVARYEEEKANSEYLSKNSTPCPCCNVNVQKSLGCNHMTCAKCKQHFCYRCGNWLDPKHPYAHFSDTLNPCWNKLWDHEPANFELWENDIEWGLEEGPG